MYCKSHYLTHHICMEKDQEKTLNEVLFGLIPPNH